MPGDTDPPQPSALLVFDTCHPGIVLRALLLAVMPLALLALYQADTTRAWALHIAWLVSAVLPATLVWLLVMCGLRHTLQRLSVALQYTLAMLLGALCGLGAHALIGLANMALVPMSVHPMHWLANALAGAMLAAVLVGWLLLRVRAEVPAATTAQLALLQARIRPHFLFNALNSAIALVREDPARAELLLQDLCDLFHAALQEKRSTIALDEEIELARRYLEIEQIRFGERLHVSWDIDPGALHAVLPPLILQPLVENAIRHGVEVSDDPTYIHILVQPTSGARVLVQVNNTLPSHAPPLPDPHDLPRAAARRKSTAGPQRIAQRGHGMALDNVRHRLHLLYDVQAQFTIRQRAGEFSVRMILPAQRPR